MKFTSLFTAFILSMAAPATAGEVVWVDSDRIFVPGGFDDNDNVQVVLDGFLENTCQTLVSPFWELDEEALDIFVTAQAFVFDDGTCEASLQPFTQVVEFGSLPYGKYNVWTNEGDLTRSLRVSESTSGGPDENWYAYITDAYVDYNDNNPESESNWSVVLKGYFEDFCQEWDYVEVIVSSDMFEVLPVVTPPTEGCPQRIRVFHKRVALPNMVHAGRHLMHVRTRGGEAFNEVFTVPE